MRVVAILGLLSIWLCSGCSSNKVNKTNLKQFSPLPPETQTHFITTYEQLPYFAELVGDFSHLARGAKLDKVTTKLSAEALRNGANLILLVDYVTDEQSQTSLEQVIGRYYFVADVNALVSYVDSVKTANKLDWNCAYLYLFRNEGAAIMKNLFTFDTYLDRKHIGPLYHNTYYKFRLTKFGQRTISLDKAGEKTISVHIEKNKTYYVQASQTLNAGFGLGDLYKTTRIMNYWPDFEGESIFENFKRNGPKEIFISE